jgi:hypothetical protein
MSLAPQPVMFALFGSASPVGMKAYANVASRHTAVRNTADVHVNACSVCAANLPEILQG